MTMNGDWLRQCHPSTEQPKADRLEQLYQDSGRTDGLYTGLHQEALRAKAAKLNPEPAI